MERAGGTSRSGADSGAHGYVIPVHTETKKWFHICFFRVRPTQEESSRGEDYEYKRSMMVRVQK